jgi:hypothetical protein
MQKYNAVSQNFTSGSSHMYKYIMSPIFSVGWLGVEQSHFRECQVLKFTGRPACTVISEWILVWFIHWSKGRIRAIFYFHITQFFMFFVCWKMNKGFVLVYVSCTTTMSVHILRAVWILRRLGKMRVVSNIC